MQAQPIPFDPHADGPGHQPERVDHEDARRAGREGQLHFKHIRLQRLASALEAWSADARRAFLAAYAEAAAGSGLFASFEDVRGLMRLAEIEKLLYELRYELDNRPAWVNIPLQGLVSLIEKPEGG